MADVYLIDGLAVEPVDNFIELDDNGVYQARAFSGSFGTNGFHLSFSNATSTTTISEDSSGNNNDFTANNISVTAGTGNDSLFDAPTNGDTSSESGAGGEVSGNYATLNPLVSTDISLSNGNLDQSGVQGKAFPATIAFPSSGKWYFEVTTSTTHRVALGIMKESSLPSNPTAAGGVGIFASSGRNTWEIYNNGSRTQNSLATPSSGDTIGVAYDADANTVQFYKGGSTLGSAETPPSTTDRYFASVGGADEASSSGSSTNFGQRAFANSAPTNFKPLCTALLPTPAIAVGSSAFDIDLYTGTGTTHERSEFSFSPDFVWIKQRNTTRNNLLYDTVRGANKFAVSNSSGTPGTGTGMVTSFDSDGFTLGNSADVNQSSGTFVAWCWDGGTSTVSNTSGSRTSSVRANATAGFSVVKFTGNGSAATVGHGLSAAPELIYLKNLNSSQLWYVYHKAMGAGKYMHLHTNAAQVSDVGMWNNVEPTSSVFTVGSYALSNDYICFCWTSIPGFSSIGSYVGTGSDDGRFVYTGFRPKYIMIKGMSTGGSNYNWAFTDTERGAGNVANHTLAANLGNGESFFGTGVNAFGANNKLDILSNGFKPRENAAFHNTSGTTYIYAAYAEHPINYSRAR